MNFCVCMPVCRPVRCSGVDCHRPQIDVVSGHPGWANDFRIIGVGVEIAGNYAWRREIREGGLQ